MTTNSPLGLNNLTLDVGQTVYATAFFAAAAPAAATMYCVEDLGGDGGYFMFGNLKLLDNVRYGLTASQMAQLKYVAGNSSGADKISIQAFMGGVWTPVATATATAMVGAPTIAGQNASIDEGQSLAGASLIKSISNPAGLTTSEYAVTDKGGDGVLMLNGIALTAGKAYQLTAAQLAQLSFVGGSTTGTDTISIQSYDGSQWSNTVNVTITVNPPPSVTVNNEAMVSGQTVAGSSLISGVKDSAGYGITQYAFMDAGTDGGQLYLNGVALAKGAWTTITAAQLSQLTYVAGAGAGTDSISIKVFDGHAWSTISVATVQQTTLLGALSNTAIASDVSRLMMNGSLSYAAMLTVLQDAEVGGMNASKFSTLQTLASMLNVSGGISTSAYVQQITKDVIDGNAANAKWNGGSSTTTPLGDLNASSSQTQVTELVGEWFLGTDLPSTNMSSVGESIPAATYKTSSNPLYGTSGTPLYTDVNQGSDGDCYFMSSIAEVALQDPTGIESMITNNGNGTYGVRFMINGHADYVTVNTQLPDMPSGYAWANGTNEEFANGNILWPELLEKAYAQLQAQDVPVQGAASGVHTDSYAAIDGGYAGALTDITGQSVTSFNLNPSSSSATLAQDDVSLASAFLNHEELLVSTPGATSGNLVGDHMFEVSAVSVNSSNALNDVFTLHNPWGSAASTSLAMTFTETLGARAADNCSVYMTTGKAVS